MQRARERRVGDDRHVVLFGEAADLQRDQVLALGDHLGGDAGAVVAQRDRVVGGVGDHHVGLGDRGHHPRAGELRAAAAQRRLDLGGQPVLAHLVLSSCLVMRSHRSVRRRCQA